MTETCNSKEIGCNFNNTNTCISKELQCDGNLNCGRRNYSDEEASLCKSNIPGDIKFNN